MPYVVSQLMAVLGFEDREFTTGMRKSRDEVKRTKKEIEEAGQRFEKMGHTLSALGGTLAVGVTAPLLMLGRQAVKTAVDMDSLKKGLIAVEGSSAGAERALKRLEQVAKLPGLGFKEAVQGYTNLRAAGLAAGQAERSLMAFGNALATVGKGKAELDGVVLALEQMASKGKVSAEEINQIAERVPQIRQIMIDAFGTADTEIIQKAGITSRQYIDAVTKELEKLPKVTGGIKNDFENATDSIEKSLNRLGTSLAPKVASIFGSLADGVDKLSASWEKLPKERQDLLTYLGLTALALPAGLAAIGKLAELVVLFGELKKVLPTGLWAGLGRAGIVGAATVTAGLLWKRNLDVAGETDQEYGKANANNASLTRYGKIVNALPHLEARARYMRRQTPDSTMYMPNFEEAQALRDAGLLPGADAKTIEEAITRLRAELPKARTAQKAIAVQRRKDFRAEQAKALPKKLPGLDAAAMAAKKKAEAEAEKERQRALKKAQEDAKRHAENFARNTQGGQDELARLNAESEFDRDRIEARQKLRDNLKSMDPATARSIYNAELKQIDRREAQDRARELSGSGMAGSLLGSLSSTVKSVQAKAERRRKLTEGLAKMPDKAGVMLSTRLDPRRLDGTHLSELEALRLQAAGLVTGHRPSDPIGMRGTEATDYASLVVRQVHAYKNAAPIAGALGRGGSGFVLDALSGNRQAASNLRDNLIDALRQGAGQEIERVIVRSLTNPIARALEAGFDPVTKKLEGAISGALKGVTGTAAMLISSSYALLAASQRKRKFGLGSFIGAVGGFLAGGPGGAIQGYNIGNALDNNDLTGAVIGGATAYGSGAFGGQPAEGRAVQIYASGWTVNDKADEKRLLDNMATRVRNAAVTGAY